MFLKKITYTINVLNSDINFFTNYLTLNDYLIFQPSFIIVFLKNNTRYLVLTPVLVTNTYAHDLLTLA